MVIGVLLVLCDRPAAGYGVFPSEAACCAPQGPAPLTAAPGAFPQGCANVTKAAEPCWVADTYWPTRQCRQSRTLCGAGEESGLEHCRVNRSTRSKNAL